MAEYRPTGDVCRAQGLDKNGMAPSSHRRFLASLVAVAAGSLLLGAALGAALVWSLFAFRAEDSTSGAVRELARRAALAHAIYAPEVRHPVEVAASEKAHLGAWLSKRLEAEVRPPDLAGGGFALLGGRLLPAEGLSGPASLPAAQFMYENANGRRVTLYVRNTRVQHRGTPGRHLRMRGVRILHWSDGRLEYALASADVSESELRALAQEARRGAGSFGTR